MCGCPTITELEVEYATDAARNGWGDSCYEYINLFEKDFKENLESLIRDVRWNSHPPTPSPAGERNKKIIWILLPFSCGRGARGEGCRNFHVTSVNNIASARLVKL